jgi:uncharacterized SAM-binding protein YcdF (DUF218 family)
MFYFSKIMTLLLLPPGIFLLLGGISLYFSVKKRSKTAFFFQITLLGLLYFLSIRPVSHWLLSPIENQFPSGKAISDKTQYIVILGGGSVSRNGHQSLSSDGMVRVVEGYILHKQTGFPVILSGGKVYNDQGPLSESEIAKERLIQMGMRPEYIKIEPESRNTFENASKVNELYAPESIVLVTAAYHMKRSVAAFQSQGIDVQPYPVNFKTEERKSRFLDFLPSMGSLNNSYYAFHEYIGMAYYAIRYPSF